MRNTLLFAMSKLPDTIHQNSFTFIDSQNTLHEFKNCESQLEPVTDLMIEMYPNQQLDIVMMCTNTSIDGLNKAKTEHLYSVYFFIQRICNINNIELPNNIEDSKLPFNNDETVREFITNRFKFIMLKLDEKENQIQRSAYDIVKYIRDKHTAENDIKGKFWIDTHGGLRDTVTTINSIMSLLRVDDIYVDEVYGVEYNENDNKIINQRQSFDMFEFVTGMNDFINFGSSEVLRQHYAKSKNQTIKAVINAMNKVSNGLQQCDPKQYTEGLDDLSDSIENVHPGDTMFDIFIDYVKKDYGILLDRQNRKSIDIVEHCLKKKMYQQALTFIEALMPNDFCNAKIIYTTNYANIDNCIIEDKKSYLLDNPDQYIFDKYVGTSPFFPSYYKKELNDKGIVDNNGYAIELLNCCTNKKAKLIASNFISNTGFNLKIYIEKNNKKYTYTYTLFTSLTNNTKEAGRLMSLHRSLKICRNLFNHSSMKERPDIDKIDQAIRMYIKLCKIVFN